MKILVGYDGSNSSKEALKLAHKHAKQFNATVCVITSMQHGTENEVADIEAANNGLEWAQNLMTDDDLTCETHLLIRGNTPGDDLVSYATENDIDEIFIGVRRRSKVGKLLMGSTAQEIILKATCPVMTVK